ncbi:probable multidrug resistance-associated protein lethal(2)03659 [Tribolium castaneum]|uniref:Putative multidrug resistance-associated protein lethal(2)03659-like Protein n=1 Tax=Tribolium castaneum TaxID=7070 RepID=D6WJV9_TRICA|nr:PREDICTED: probable multidrug resistance-associated protein lethal(2)03659 [Tribolium castaneum]EFA03658.1 putative multidrug resistance-associated protein lethal(2)03659-like Protein [Tribolium castaneum]|eukprot:XP_973658.2 PREDICTED: probable multidrug resistance-associated protein lethal(2)03659 [Tribolium castaneum]
MEKYSESQLPSKLQPSENASFLSKLFFCWAPKFFYDGYTKHPTEEYYATVKSHSSCYLAGKLEKSWERASPSLWKALWKTFHFEFVALCLLFIISEFTFKISQPWLVAKLMEEIINSKNEYYLYGFLVILVNFLSVIVGHFYHLKVQHLGMKIRISCCSLIYQKALKISKQVESESKMGKIVNLLSNDVNRFDLAPMHLINLIVAPFETLFVIFSLYATVGTTAVSGIVFLAVFMPLQMYMGKLTTTYRLKSATNTDRRIKLMNEIITGIKVIKMFVWEKLFVDIIEKARRLEVRQIRKISNIRALNVSFMLFINRTGIFLSVMTYFLVRKQVDAKYVFVLSSFYAILRQTLTVYLPFAIQNFSETRVSVERIRLFLTCDEQIAVTYVASDKEQLVKRDITIQEFGNIEGTKVGIRLKNASVKWLLAENYSLNSVNFEVFGEFVIVSGPVGGGKSTLLYTILKELPLDQGELSVKGILSYMSQEPWLFSGTVQQNILFGSKFDKNKYNTIVQICQLEADLSTFPYGDHTLVGENGALLSGGQKTRINLARALYSDADIYLLDDPFASVDTIIGKKIFQDCILTYLRNKCVVLVTNQQGFFAAADRVYTLDKGILTNNVNIYKKEYTFEEQQSREHIISGEKITELKLEPKKGRQGNVTRQVYAKYAKSAGNCSSHCLLFFLFLASQIAASGADYFVAFWVNLSQSSTRNSFTDDICLQIYLALIIATITLSIARSITFFRLCIKASVKLHNCMFAKVIKAPITFFETNPSGEILNRFSKDIGMVDETIPSILMDTFQIAFIILGSVVLIIFLNPWMLIPTLVIFPLFYFFKIWFLKRSRNLKRLEASARTPIYTHVRETLKGLTVIRTYNAEITTKRQFSCYQDLHSSAFYTFMTCNRAFGFWLDLICMFYTIGVIASIMLMETQAGSVGLSITQSINLIGVLQWGIKQWSELENQMINVERVSEYTEISPEQSLTKNLGEIWPSEGQIKFQSVSMRYPQSGRLTLDNISFTVEPREKIGIIGRTGAGKSSLVSTLFRLYNFEGKILVDGVNTCEIPLDTLRSKISIIPQEPILFTGTLRENLDPFGEFPDAVLWNVLEQVKLKSVVANFSDGLSVQVLEGGSNFSVGQKQLICLGRAILRKNKILILDEATANIDFQTDRFIQETVQSEFKNCTVLTVAHRINTVMDSDKIMVLDDGKLVEFDSPSSLLRNSDGLFRQVVDECKESLSKAK